MSESYGGFDYAIRSITSVKFWRPILSKQFEFALTHRLRCGPRRGGANPVCVRGPLRVAYGAVRYRARR